MTDELYSQIKDALQDRVEWEDRQRRFYQMRHRGLRRVGKPYPGAPDLHFPLVDSTIEKLKPFYVQQVYTGESVATFISLRAQDSELTSSNAMWFDYQLKQNSNFDEEIMTAIDVMLMSGRAPVKVYWDTRENRLAFDACDPLHVIVPKWTKEWKNADWLVHVLQLSEAQYRANPNYKQGDDFIQTITGKGTSAETSSGWGEAAKEQAIAGREGITYGRRDQIVLWEIYTKDEEGNVQVETVSPVRPQGENVVRQAFTLPYNRGVFAEKGGRFPFSGFRAEIKDKGYYSPRGIPEILGPFETALCKLWNGQFECMDFFNRPMFKNSGRPIGNASNVRFIPGGIAPEGLEPIQMPSPPISYSEEMQNTRAVSEYRVNLPDLGTEEHLTPNGGGKKTATEVNAIVGQSGQSNDIRARVFRKDLGDVFMLAWSLLIQYAGEDLQFLVNEEVNQLEPDSLHDDYIIIPNGSPDAWNRGAELQKALSVGQMVGNSPDIAQDELTKLVLEKWDPRYVNRLFRPRNLQASDQQEEQNFEIVLMLGGFGAEVRPSDDDKTHLQALLQFGQGRMQEQNPPTPLQAQLLGTHAQAHLQQLQGKKDPQLKVVAQQVMPFIQICQQIAAAGQQQQPSNVVPGPGAPPQQPPQPPQEQQQQQAKESIAINYKDAPPSIQRQMEAKAGFQPASMQEAVTAEALRAQAKKPTPKPQLQPA